MKTRNLIVAALLLGGMTVFNSCSEKEIDNITPPIDQPVAEELETVLAFSTGFGNSFNTKADDGNKYNNEYEIIRNYAQFVFEINSDGSYGALKGFYGVKGSIQKPVFGSKDYYDKHKYNNENWLIPSLTSAQKFDPWGFYLQPLKLKTAATQLAVVVLANCDEVFNTQAEGEVLSTTITNFAEFEQHANSVDLPLMLNTEFGGYPMSTNVHVIDIQPGKVNTVGFGDDKTGANEYEKCLEVYGLETDLADLERHISTTSTIKLYRCWSLVKLTNIAVEPFSVGATDAKFELEEAFVMNVPTKTNVFNKNVKGTANWGGELNISLENLLKIEPAFYSGYDKDQDEVESSEGKWGPGEAYDKGYRSDEIAGGTEFYGNYYRPLRNAISLQYSTIRNVDLTSSAYSSKNWNTLLAERSTAKPVVAKPQMNENNIFTYVVAPSTYGLVDGKQDTEQSMVLVVKGKYSQLINGVWVAYGSTEEEGGSGSSTIESTYYTVAIGGEDSQIKAESVPNIVNTVIRNVDYQIDLTVKGPGSTTPVLHIGNTYLVPKVSIIPFGTVKQTAEID